MGKKMLPLFGVMVAVCLPAQASGDAGDLDPGFGDNGIVTTRTGYYNSMASNVAIQPDGRLVVVGRRTIGPFPNDIRRFVLRRYHPDGSLDTGFGDAGLVVTSLGQYQDSLSSVALQVDGRIVVGGHSGRDMAVARYLPDGQLDPDFNTVGWIRVDFYGQIDWVSDLVIQPDGRILAVGYVQKAGGSQTADFGLARFLPDGSLDASFGSGGKLTTDFNGLFDTAHGVELLPDGRFVVVGRSMTDYSLAWGDLALARYHPDGSLDDSFGTGGRVWTDLGEHELSLALALYADGAVVVGGQNTTAEHAWVESDFVIARYRPNGSLDPDFGSGGWVVSSFQGADRLARVALQADGRIIAAGWTAPTTSSPRDMVLLRLNRDGTLDDRFGAGGWVVTDFAGDWDSVAGLAIQNDGRIVAAGTTSIGDPYVGMPAKSFLVARYEGLGDPGSEIESLIAGVEDLVESGALNGGQGNALLVKLEGALEMLSNVKDHVAVNRLEAFVNQVGDLIATEVLEPQEGQPLIDWALLVIESIESP